MLATPIRLAIVDDHALFRKTLKKYLLDQKDIVVSIEASHMLDLIEQLKNSPIDVMIVEIMDGSLPRSHNLEGIKIIRRHYPDIRILVLSFNQDMDIISELLENGIYGCISKTDDLQDLLEAIHAAHENRIFRNKLFTEALYWNKQHHIRSRKDEPKVILSERERKILQLIWEEKSNKMIADELFLGIRSIEKIRQDIKDKIGTKSTVGLIKYAIDKKIIGLHTLKQY